MILSSFLDFNSKYFLEIGGIGITWYATCILTGILLATWMGIREARRFHISPNVVIDGVLICVPLSIIGARIYYVIFALDEFIVKGDPMQSFLNMLGFTENGFQLAGLSITGGVIVAIIFVIIYSRIRKINVFAIFDLLAPGLLIGQICGRWGNFFNQEAHGGIISPETLNILQHIIPGFIMDKMYIGGVYYHPTFLYESLWNLLGLIIILIMRRKSKKVLLGDSVCFYLIWYGIGRSCLIEPFRTDPLWMGSIKINILVPAIFAVCGIIWMVLKHTKFKQQGYIDYQRMMHENDTDTVIFKVDDVIANITPLLKNAYYYTLFELENKNTLEDELTKMIQIEPSVYFKDKPESLAYFNQYLLDNLDQVLLKKRSKDFFKMLNKYDINCYLVSKYSKEYLVGIAVRLGITPYVSLYQEESNTTEFIQNSNFENRHVLVISDTKNDLVEASKKGYKSALVNYSKDFDNAKEAEPSFIINELNDLFDIMVR